MERVIITNFHAMQILSLLKTEGDVIFKSIVNSMLKALITAGQLSMAYLRSTCTDVGQSAITRLN